MVWSVCCVKRSQLGGKYFADDEEVEMEVWTWLRHEWKDLYATGFGALVKRWDMCINVGGGYEEIKAFPRFKYHMFSVSYPFVTYLLPLPHT
jgi:hypothetical protein